MQIVCTLISLSDEGNVAKKKGLEIKLNPLLSCFVVVGDERFELPTLYMSSRCSNQLS